MHEMCQKRSRNEYFRSAQITSEWTGTITILSPLFMVSITSSNVLREKQNPHFHHHPRNHVEHVLFSQLDFLFTCLFFFPPVSLGTFIFRWRRRRSNLHMGLSNYFLGGEKRKSWGKRVEGWWRGWERERERERERSWGGGNWRGGSRKSFTNIE